MAKILIIDDEEYIRDILSTRVEGLNHTALSASSIAQGLELLKKELFDLVFLDVKLPDGSGLELLKIIQQLQSKPEVIIITAVGSLEGAEIAIKNGAWDYLNKPLKKEDIILRINRALEYRKIKKKKSETVVLNTESIIGKSPAIKKCFEQIAQCVSGSANVLLSGETGTGKEVFARAIHDNSNMTGDNFVIVDCAAMPKNLAESVLFGHVKGAFTGADKTSDGLVIKADKGTLFLDEIGELPLSLQTTFLRVLQEKRFRPVGSPVEKHSDFRLISATNRELDQMVSEGTFRKDLLHRIRTFHIELPPLRDRTTDIQELSNFYIKKICEQNKLNEKVLLPETIDILKSYDWPGNVRELIHTIERTILNEPDSSLLYPYSLPDNIRLSFLKQELPDSENREELMEGNSLESILLSSINKDAIPNLKDFRNLFLEKIEKVYLKSILSNNQWNIEKTAQISGLSNNRIYVLIKKYDLKR